MKFKPQDTLPTTVMEAVAPMTGGTLPRMKDETGSFEFSAAGAKRAHARACCVLKVIR
jgi:hypothetical protein